MPAKLLRLPSHGEPVMNDYPLLIGIGAKARHGKGTVSAAIYAAWRDKYDVREYTFGAELKAEVNAADQFALCLKYGIPYDANPDMTDPLCQTKHGKQSRLLQFVGVQRREKDPYYWVKKLDARLKEDKPAVALISDMRFLNEYYYVKSHGGITVKVNRMGFVDLSRDPNHISETELEGKEFDYVLTVPDGDVAELRRDALQVAALIEKEVSVPVPDLTELVNAAC